MYEEQPEFPNFGDSPEVKVYNAHHLGTHWQIGYGGFRYHLQPYPWTRHSNVQNS